jgi:lipoprotein-anchoring transpeptidase ErfK/SrfK
MTVALQTTAQVKFKSNERLESMMERKRRIVAAFAVGLLFTAGCVVHEPNGVGTRGNANAKPANSNSSNTNSTPSAGSSNAPSPAASADWAITLPVINAFFGDEKFVPELKSKVGLSEQQISQLREISRKAAGESEGNSDENGAYVSDLHATAEREIRQVTGDEKAAQLFRLVASRWGGEDAAEGMRAFALGLPPPDTRIVINIPAFRMDVFEDGRPIKSYKVGIGYPRFPLPTGLRKAETIIFNPPWTPPDSPWVGEMKGGVESGKTIKPGDKLNPLGRLKIPIGMPSLIHGGKPAAKIGTFASHGCVGLTDSQVVDFAKLLARLGGSELTDQQISEYGKKRTQTETVKLARPIPVELRYETILVEDGKLHVYLDVYDRGTNTDENLAQALQAYGVTNDQLSETDRARAREAFEQMSRVNPNAANRADSNPNSPAKNSNNKNTRPVSKTGAIRAARGAKEIVIDVAALHGKGYPAPVALDDGQPVKKPVRTRPARRS